MIMKIPDSVKKLWQRYCYQNSGLLFFSIAAIVVLAFLLLFHKTLYSKSSDILVEICGFFFDLCLFGIAFSIYEKWRKRRDQIADYQAQLQAFKSWAGEEGILRKTWLIRRLNEIEAPLPDMNDIMLKGAKLNSANLVNAMLHSASLESAYFYNVNLKNANLVLADLKGALFTCANLQGAKFMAANLRGAGLLSANLYRADLVGANLIGAVLSRSKFGDKSLDAKNLTWRQLKRTDFNYSTKFPSYLMKDIPDWAKKKLKEPEDKDEGSDE